MRPISIETGFSKYAEGSCLIRFGDTHVLCCASVEDKVPPFLRNTGKGWVAAGRFPLKRGSYGIGGGDWNDVVADDLEVRFNLLLLP